MVIAIRGWVAFCMGFAFCADLVGGGDVAPVKIMFGVPACARICNLSFNANEGVVRLIEAVNARLREFDRKDNAL